MRARRTQAAVLACAAVLLGGSCGRSDAAERAAVATGGEPRRAPALVRHYGCHSCHEVKGVTGANGRVGPPLSTLGERAYIAGTLPNTPENLVRWIMNPQSVHSHTAMPDLSVSERDARDIAAYLYSLR